MVDEIRVLRLLRGLSDDLGVLRGEATAGADRRADPMWLRGVKYTFITLIETCVDIAQHICAAQGWGPPSDNGDAVKLLGRHEVLTARLAGLGDLDDFVSQVTASLGLATPDEVFDRVEDRR